MCGAFKDAILNGSPCKGTKSAAPSVSGPGCILLEGDEEGYIILCFVCW